MEIHQTEVAGRMRIMDRNAVVGWIEGDQIEFHGFASPGDAARAAWEAHRGIHEHRTGRKLGPAGDLAPVSLELGPRQYVVVAGRGRIARLLAPAGPREEFDRWGFVMGLSVEDELELLNHEPQVFHRTRARVMWRAIRRAGLDGSRRQWANYETMEEHGGYHGINTGSLDNAQKVSALDPAAAGAASERAGTGAEVADRNGRSRVAGVAV